VIGMPQSEAAILATAYVDSVGAKKLGLLDDLFAEDLVATLAGDTFDKAQWISALARLLPVLVRNDIRKVFTDGDDACVVYDFVTDTAAGAVPCVELVTVRDGRIVTIELIFEKANWPVVVAALQERASR
jgi:ketosteroid isomerase-like protein